MLWEYALVYTSVSFLIGTIMHFVQGDWPKEMRFPYWGNVLVGASVLPVILSLPVIAVGAFFVSIYNSVFGRKESDDD